MAMRLPCYLLLAVVLLLLTSCHAISSATDLEETKETAVLSESSPLTRTLATDKDSNRKRFLRNIAFGKSVRNDEEYDDDAIADRKDSETEEERALNFINRLTVFNDPKQFFGNVYWHNVFTFWATTLRRTPESVFKKFNIQGALPSDRKYRVYHKYLRWYEEKYGAT